jgi:hypothetical protein
MNATRTEITGCPKCDGKGRIHAFGHYANGVCFECGGTGEIEITASTPAEVAQAARSAAHANGVRALAMKIGTEANRKTYTAVGSLIVSAHTERNTFPCTAPAGSFAASKRGRELLTAYDEAVQIIDAAVSRRNIARSAIARLGKLAEIISAQ